MATTKKTYTRRFGKYLHQRRTDANLTLRQLAKTSRIPHNTLSQIESGHIDPKLSRVDAIAHSFGQDIVDFLTPVDKGAIA